MQTLRRVLSYQVSVGALLELAMWLAIPYIAVGLVFTFFVPSHAARFEALLQTRLPAGAELVAFGESALLWPVLMFAPEVCMLR